jgi:DNA repair exonuclease SbcCD ATPase subunit
MIMQDSEKTSSLLSRVQARLRIDAFSKSFFVWLMITAGIAVIATLVVRLGGLVPPSQQRPEWLLAAPAAALVLAILLHRRATREAAARAVDQHVGAKDLFLTWSTLGQSAGEYQPLVAQEAETAAQQVRPVEVVPYRFGRPVLNVLASTAVLLLVVAFFPQFDPLGKVEAAEKAEDLKKEVTAIRRANRDRSDQLKRKADINDELSDEISKEVEGLKSAFREMKPQQRKENSKILDTKRSALNEQWKMVSNDQLRNLLSQQASAQQFGGTRSQKMNEWLKELQKGMTSSLEKKMEETRETMNAMMNAKTPEERQKLASKLRRDLQDLKKFASEKADSKELAAALDKALKSLEAAAQNKSASNDDGMTEEAMQALKESLDLSKQELQELARSAKDLQKLEEAIKTLQQAQKLNQDGQLDGEQCEGCNSLSDYAELYKKLMAQRGEPGEGMGNQGFGKGGEAPEDDSDPEGYKREKSKTQVLAGKVLLSIKTKEYATERDFDESELRQYQENVSAIKSGVQAAIESEQVPPGYVDAIKGYFDKLENVDPGLSTAPSGK